MASTTDYYVVKEKALPEVLLNVVKAKKLLETRKVSSVQEAAEAVGIAVRASTNIKTIFFFFMTIHRVRRSL